MKSRWVALFFGTLASLACSDAASSDDGGSNSGGSVATGGTSSAGSSNGGSATSGGTDADGGSTSGTGTGGLGGTTAGTDAGGAPEGGEAGTSGATTGGQSGTGGGGTAGTGGTTEWSCQAADDVCTCGPVMDPNVTDCGGDWSCCVYYVASLDDGEREVCACDSTPDADCEERALGLYRGRRETTCPPE